MCACAGRSQHPYVILIIIVRARRVNWTRKTVRVRETNFGLNTLREGGAWEPKCRTEDNIDKDPNEIWFGVDGFSWLRLLWTRQ